MTLPDFTQPLSADAPCGPDLLMDGDTAFDDYDLDASERLPDKFFNAEGKALVDPASIRVQDELTKAANLLSRAYDLRVLAALAQYCALARNLSVLTDVFEATAILLETHGKHVHPQMDGEIVVRQNTLELLANKPTLVMPLEFMPMAEDRRLRALTWRKYAVAMDLRRAMAEDGQTVDAESLLAALRSAENGEQVSASHALLKRLDTAAQTIQNLCLIDEDMPFRPDLDPLRGQVGDMLRLLEQARPDLAGGVVEDTADDAGSPQDMPTHSGAGPTPHEAAPAPAGSIGSLMQARRALDALDAYFSVHEPSSPSFLLVRQARELVGRPLVEALELLVPERFESARIDFSRDMGFVLTMDRMRALSELDRNDSTEDESDLPVVATRAEAASMMSALERYFTTTEPSSPVPLLMTRARGYLNQSFSAILAELFPPEDD
ncbi:type VI secretion system ImpA family N-terminal domain-containing protein [Roseibaca sp. V10]|uniref:Type VI secretion system ImpA family N-terminal domain-containing protein n=1 Tax=Roseinatronobacter domitianus TaxID=2940293 RepID=A0ABT0M2W8_9RHOB|nr:type VI secretion system ImpA family N-terminal domain-containing protein [Roseibaca domitiana]MCL1629204.1 type VI secretion system ImpA family N-terminal domain-containing protein [Roseibaca domitiana]